MSFLHRAADAPRPGARAVLHGCLDRPDDLQRPFSNELFALANNGIRAACAEARLSAHGFFLGQFPLPNWVPHKPAPLQDLYTEWLALIESSPGNTITSPDSVTGEPATGQLNAAE